MLRLRNCDVDEFARRTEGKKIICFGAWIMPANFCKAYPQYHFEERIVNLSDNDQKKWGTQFLLDNGVSREVVSPDTLKEIVDKDTVLFITSMYFAAITEQLDAFTELDGTDCYIYPFMQYDRTFPVIKNLRNSDKQLIPKKIHYFWFGRNPKPPLAIKCIESWKKFCPDYEMIEWNEDNYDYKKTQFMRDAYENKKWGFVTDYARLDIINEIGGLYFDTDVELIRPIDDLLYNEAFFCFGNYGRIASGLGFGSVSGQKVIKELVEEYSKTSFYKPDGSIDPTTNTMHEEPAYLRCGLRPDDTFQIIDKAVMLTSDFMAPLIPGFNTPRMTENTISIHHNQFSWGDPEQVESMKKSEKDAERVRNRFCENGDN